MRSRFDPRRPLAVLGLLALVVGAGLPALEARAQGSPAAIADEHQAFWRDKAAKVRAEVASAAEREQQATAAYTRMMTRNYPKGTAKAAIIKEREDATKALAEARLAVGEFKDEARREGVPDRWIDPEGEAPPWWTNPGADS